MRKFFLFFALFTGIILLLPQVSFAQTAQSGNAISVGKDQTINGDYFTAGNAVAVHGAVNGDVYVAGGNVDIDGTITGDILAAGGTLLIQGSAHNVRVVGGNVTIDGTVDGNVTSVGGNITIADGAKITGSLVAAGGQIAVLAPIGKGATLAGGQVTLDNSIGADVLGAGNITLTPNAKINGNFTYWNNLSAKVASGAIISGKTTHNIPPQRKQQNRNTTPNAVGIVGASLMFGLISLVSSFIVGILFVQLVPVFSQNTVNTIRERPWFSLGVGFIAAIAMPFILLVLFITILGIPLAFLFLIVYGIYVYISKIFVSLVIGIWILEKTNTRKVHLVWALLLGLVIYEILGIIPFIGWLIGLIFWFIGMGGLLITKRDAYLTLRSKKLI